MEDQNNLKLYLIYGGIIVVIILILVISCIYVEYYKRKVKRLKLELYRETQAKENQLSSIHTSVLTTHYNFPSFMTNENNVTQNSLKKGSYLDNFEEDEDDMTTYSNYIPYSHKRKEKLSYISEGMGEIPNKSRDKYQSLYSANTTIHSIHSSKPSYSYYSLNNQQDNYPNHYSLNRTDINSNPIDHSQENIQHPPSLYLNSHNNILFYDEVPNGNVNSQADSMTTISTTTTTTITTNTNLNSTSAKAFPPVTLSNRSNIMSGVSNVRNYITNTWSRPQVLPKAHENLKINTSLKSGSNYLSNMKPSPSSSISLSHSPNSTPMSSNSTTPKHRLLKYSSNGSFLQHQNHPTEESAFFTTKPLSTTMITATTVAMNQASSYGQYSLNSTTFDTPTEAVVDNKRISLVQSQEKYSQSPSSSRTSMMVDSPAYGGLEEQSLSPKDSTNDIKKKKNENRRSYTDQLKPVLSKISLAELKEANASRPQSAKLSSEKRKVIKVKKHLSYTEQLTPVLSDKRSSILSEHRLSSLDKSKYRHSVQSIQSIHSVQSTHSIHNVVDEELVSPRPISLISNQRLSFMTSEIEEQLNKEDLQSTESEPEEETKIEDEVVIVEKEEREDTLSPDGLTKPLVKTPRLSWNVESKEGLEDSLEKNPKHSSALARVSLLIDTLENTAAALSSPSMDTETENRSDTTTNIPKDSKPFIHSPLLNQKEAKSFVHSPLLDPNEEKPEFPSNSNKHASLTFSIEDSKNDNKRNSERSSRYYSKQRLSLISNYSEVSEHNNNNNSNSNSNNSGLGNAVLKLFKKPSVSTVSSSVTSAGSHSPFSKRRSVSPLNIKNHSSFVSSPLEKELPNSSSSLKGKNDHKQDLIVEEEEEEEEEENLEIKGKNNTSFMNSSILMEEESIDSRKDTINEETASSKKTLSVSSSSLSRSIYMDVRKDGSTIPSMNDSEVEADSSSSHRRGNPGFIGLYNFFEVRPAKSKQRKALSSGSSSKSGLHKDTMRFEEVSESDINPLAAKNYILYDSDSMVTDRMSHESKKHSINSSSSNFNNYNYDYNTSFSYSQKNLKFTEGGKDKMMDREKEKILDVLKENNNSSSINSSVSGPMVKNAIYSYYSNPSNNGNSQYQNENLNLKFINNSFNGSVNFNNESFDTNEDEDDIITSVYGLDMGERPERVVIDRRSLYSMNQPVKPPKSQRRQYYSNANTNGPNRFTPSSNRDDDLHSVSSASLNFAEIQKYQNASMPLSLDKYKNYYYQGPFAKSNTSSTSQTTPNVYSFNNPGRDRDEEEVSKDTTDNREMNTSFISKSHSLLARSTSEHSSHSTMSYQSNTTLPYKRLAVSSPVSTISSSNNRVTSPPLSRSSQSEANLGEAETVKNHPKKSTPEPLSAASFKSSTSVVSYTSSNYSSDLKEGHNSVNESEKLPQRVKDSIPKRSQYSSQKEHRRSSSSHRKRKHSGSAHLPSIITSSTKTKDKTLALNEAETEGSLSLTLFSPSQSVNKMYESKSPTPALGGHSSSHLTPTSELSDTNTISPVLPKRPKGGDPQDPPEPPGNNHLNLQAHPIVVDMNLNKEIKSPESLDSAKTLNNSQLILTTRNHKEKEQENSSLKTPTPFSNVNSQTLIEEKGDGKIPSLRTPFSYYQSSNSSETTVPLLRDIISDSILQMQSQNLNPIRGKVHILADSSSPNTSPNTSPVPSYRYIKSGAPDSETSKNDLEVLDYAKTSSSEPELEGQGQGPSRKEEERKEENRPKEEQDEEEEEPDELESNSSQPMPSFIFNDDTEAPLSHKPLQFSQDSDSVISVGSIPRLPGRMPEKRKFDSLHNNTSPLLKTHSFKKKLLSSGRTSPIYSKSTIHLTPTIPRKASPLSYYNALRVRNNYSPLSRIEEDGSMEQTFTSPRPTYPAAHYNLENGAEGNNDFSLGTDTSRTSDSTNATEYKNIPNATDQSASLLYNKSSLSTSSDDDFDDEEIISMDINLISQDDASTYNSPLLFPVITPPNYEQLLKDQSYKL